MDQLFGPRRGERLRHPRGDDRIREVRGTPFGDHESTGTVHALGDVKIEVPLIPRTFYAAGLNYVKHISEYAEQSRQPRRPSRRTPTSAIARTMR